MHNHGLTEILGACAIGIVTDDGVADGSVGRVLGVLAGVIDKTDTSPGKDATREKSIKSHSGFHNVAIREFGNYIGKV